MFQFCRVCFYGAQRPAVCGRPGLTRYDFIRINAADKAKRVVEYAVDAPAAVIQPVELNPFSTGAYHYKTKKSS
jgi:hypothetical protein